MNLHDKQRQVVKCPARFRVVNAGRRAGKTVLAVEELLFAAVTKEANVAYIAPTYVQARDIAWNMLKNRIQPLPGVVCNESRLEVLVPNQVGTQSKISLRGFESVESLRGLSFDFIILDEVAMYRNFESGWEEVIRPTLTDRKGRVLFISTPKGFNFWYDLFNMEQKDSDYKSFTFTSADNPHIPQDEIEALRKQMTPDRFAQEMEAQFKKVEGLVYKEFDRLTHLFDEVPKDVIFYETYVGVDWGYTNPTAIIKIGKDQRNSFWVLQEWYKEKQTTEDIVNYVASLNPNAVYPDPAEPDRVDMLRRLKLNVKDVNKDIVMGIDVVRSLFKNKRLFIQRNCFNTVLELETYSYPDKKPDRNPNEKPMDENNHLLDALRYVLCMQATANPKQGVHQYVPNYGGRRDIIKP